MQFVDLQIVSSSSSISAAEPTSLTLFNTIHEIVQDVVDGIELTFSNPSDQYEILSSVLRVVFSYLMDCHASHLDHLML